MERKYAYLPLVLFELEKDSDTPEIVKSDYKSVANATERA